MAGQNWVLPENDTIYTSVLQILRERDEDTAMGHSTDAGVTLGTNLPEGTIKFDKSASKWVKLDSGGNWPNLVTKYSIDVDKLDGQHGSYYQNASNISSGTIGNSYLPSSIGIASGNANATTFTGTSFTGDILNASGLTVVDVGTGASPGSATFLGDLTGNASTATTATTATNSLGVQNTNATAVQVLTVGSNANGTDAVFTGKSAYINCTADEATTTALYPAFTGATGSQAALTSSKLTYIPSTGKLSMSEMQSDHINIQGNTISTTNTDGNLILAPKGIGYVEIGNLRFDGSSIWSSGDTVTVSDKLTVTEVITANGKMNAAGDITSDKNIISGEGSGGVALTINDGYGNANITFNHVKGKPEQNGNSARIEVNTDSTSGAIMTFELKSNTILGTAVQTSDCLKISESNLSWKGTTMFDTNSKMNVSRLTSIPAEWNKAYTAASLGQLSVTAGGAFSLQKDHRFAAGDTVYVGTAHEYMKTDPTGKLEFYADNQESMALSSTGNLDVRGDITAYATSITSDKNLKTAISTVSDALTKVSQLNGVEFTFKGTGKRSAGIIAQDVEKVLPQAVTERELPLQYDDGVKYKTVDYNALHSLYIEAIKELKDIVEGQALEIEKLKG